MINKIPLELEPPSPMQPPPLRRKPFIIPKFGNTNSAASVAPLPLVFD